MIGHSHPVEDIYRCRLDALEQTWEIWGRLGEELTEEQWSRPSRCPGWDVTALYAHYSRFPLDMSTPPSAAAGPVGEPLTAVELMKRFNAPNGVAHTMAGAVAEVPPQALRDTVLLLAAIAPPVEFIEAATGRSTHSPLPVLR